MRLRLPFSVYDTLLENRIILTTGIRAELTNWLTADSRIVSDHAKTVLTKLENTNNKVITNQAFSFPDDIGINYYYELLKSRRYYGEDYCSALIKETNCRESELANHCVKRFGQRASKVYLKGYLDRHNRNRFSDDELIIQAIYHGLESGSDVAVFTADTDFAEQFLKLAGAISGDYMSMLVASAMLSGRFDDAPRSSDADVNACAPKNGGKLRVLFRKEYDYYHLLPSVGDCIRFHIVTLATISGGKSKYFVSALTYTFDRRVLDLLRVKKAGNGLNTTSFNGCNVRVGSPSKGVRPIVFVLDEPYETFRGFDLLSLDVKYMNEITDSIVHLVDR